MSSIREKHLLGALDHIEIALRELETWGDDSQEMLYAAYQLRVSKRNLSERIKHYENHD